MVLESPLYMQANTTSARQDRQFLGVLLTEGLIHPADLKVSQRAGGANMSVDVAPGRAVIVGDDQADQGSYLCRSTAVENLPIGAPPGSNSRIDLVVARVRDATVTGGTASDWLLEVIPGVVAASPVAPSTPASAIALAQVRVDATDLSVLDAKITDRRRSATSNLPGSSTWISAVMMRAQTASPTLSGIDLFPAWFMDAAVEEAVAFSFDPHNSWATYDVELWWSNAGAGAGNVVWRLDRTTIRDSLAVGAAVLGAPATVAAPAQSVVRKTVLATGITRTDLAVEGARVVRVAADAGDTLGNDAMVLGVRLVRAS